MQKSVICSKSLKKIAKKCRPGCRSNDLKVETGEAESMRSIAVSLLVPLE
jgi:hypothetical protein